MEYFKILERKIDDDNIELYIESLDSAILELIIEKMNYKKGFKATYIEEHPLTHRYRLIVQGKNCNDELKKEIQKLSSELLFSNTLE